MWFFGRLLPPTFASSVADDDAHGAAGTGDHADGGLDVGAVEIAHLLLGDLADIFLADGGDLVTLRHAGGGLDAAGLLDQQSRGGRLGDEGEAAVGVNGDDAR